jgi:succinate-semialdehyde dehydrogenase/glutarate-semialdehyde dehydrogenase
MYQSINPFTGEVISSYQELSNKKLEDIINKTHQSFLNWKQTDPKERTRLMHRLAEKLLEKKEELAILITSEMGKIITESVAEIEKCAWLCHHYADHAASMLEEEGMNSDGTISYVRFDPIGVIYAIMPWNFPFWQVFRFAVPTIMAGNTVLLKHAPNVFGSATAIEELFLEAGFPEYTLSNLIISIGQSDDVIANPMVQGVTLTGSQKAGRMIASVAGKFLKKSVMELGGSDPYIVLKDAEINHACKTGMCSRMLNAGQVCISAKRFIVEESIFDDFVAEQKSLLENMILGDPMLKETEMGPMARPDLLEQIEQQVNESVKMGAELITGGKRINERFYAPTLLINARKGMPVYDEETFGPVSVIIPVKDAEDAVRIANDTEYGLGASIWTQNIELAEKMAAQLEAGAVFINGMTKSDPRLPFGGTKRSGYGRELSHFGIREFVNIKTVWVK